jgi:hypothetical protein
MRHLYHIYFHPFSLLTGPLWIMNPYHITPIFIIPYPSGLAASVCVLHNSPSSSSFVNILVLGHISFMKLLSHQQASFLSPWCCLTVSARLPTCVCLRATQMWRLSAPSLLPLLISLGVEPGPWVMHTRVAPRWGPRRHSRLSGRVTAVVVVPSWHVTADWELRCNQPQVPWSHEGICACMVSSGEPWGGGLYHWLGLQVAARRWCRAYMKVLIASNVLEGTSSDVLPEIGLWWRSPHRRRPWRLRCLFFFLPNGMLTPTVLEGGPFKMTLSRPHLSHTKTTALSTDKSPLKSSVKMPAPKFLTLRLTPRKKERYQSILCKTGSWFDLWQGYECLPAA